MLTQQRLPDVVRPDPWALFCPVCSHQMQIRTAFPAHHGGADARIYECTYACPYGHKETVRLGVP